MIRFNNDYNHGAFASILKELGATNSTSYAGYGEDEWCDKAETIIKKLDRKSTRLNSSHASNLSLHDALPILHPY